MNEISLLRKRDRLFYNEFLKRTAVQKYSALEHFQIENALLTQARQSPRSGVDFGENDVFPQNDALKHRVFQKQNALKRHAAEQKGLIMFGSDKHTQASGTSTSRSLLLVSTKAVLQR